MDRQERREAFRKVRLEMCMSQTKIGSHIGMSGSDISAIETGRGGRAPTKMHMRFLAWIKLAHDNGLEL